MAERIKGFISRCSLALTIVGFLVAFWPVTPFVSVDLNKEFWYDVALIVMFVVAATWVKETFRVFWINDWSGPGLLRLAIFWLAMIVLQNRVLSLINFRLDRPAWIYESHMSAYLAYQTVGVGVLILCAVAKMQIDQNYESSPFYIRMFWLGLVAGGFIAGASFTLFLGQVAGAN